MKKLTNVISVTFIGAILLLATIGQTITVFAGNDNIVELSGVLNTVWQHPGPGLPPDFPVENQYDLVTDGESFMLDGVEEVTRELGGPHEFNREDVIVTGMLDPATNRVDVLSIRLDVIPPIGSPIGSHLLGAHFSGSQKWVSILCRFGDSTTVTPQPLTFFQNLMTFMDNYWRELSYNEIDLVGSDEVGWFNMVDPRSAYFNADGDALLGKLLDDCAAAADASVNFPDFDGINLMFNEDIGCCSWGGSATRTLDGVMKTYSMTWMATWGWGNQGVLGQEMGHGFGLPHSSGPYAATYDSLWDVQSAAFGTCSPPDPQFGCIGVHTVSFHKDALGWIPGAQVYVATPAANQFVFIQRLALPPGAGFLEVRIPIGASTTDFYTVESRKFAGFDDGIPAEAVVIHKVDTTLGDRNAQVVDDDGVPPPNDAGARWLAGELFVDAVNNISVGVLAMTSTGFDVVINPTPAEINGMKFNDLNANGIKDGGEPGLPGWTITLSCDNGFNDSTTTDANGNYSFMDIIAPVECTISEVLQAGWIQTSPPAPGTHVVQVQPGDIINNRDFGNILASTIVIVKDSIPNDPQDFQFISNIEALYSINPGLAVGFIGDDQLRRINPNTAATLSSVTITLPSSTVIGGTGLATHPQTGDLFALLKLQGQSTRELVTIDPDTGVATSIGDTGEKFAGLAFDSSGTLFAVSGDGAAPPESLFTVSTLDATSAFVCTLGNGNDGETIAFNPTDGLIYHASGLNPPFSVGPLIFERIVNQTTDPCTVANIPIGAPPGDEEANALTFWVSRGHFLWADGFPGDSGLHLVTAGGAAATIGLMDHRSKGLAFVGSTFFLDDDADPTLPNTRTFNNLLPGTYDVTEIVPPGFVLSALFCQDPTGNTTVDFATATTNINVAPGETVTCTYEDTKLGTIIINKDTQPSPRAQDFTYDSNRPGIIPTFSLDDDNDPTLPNTRTFDNLLPNNVLPGPYIVRERPNIDFLTSVRCVEDATANTSTVGLRAIIELDPGETVECTFTNALDIVKTIHAEKELLVDLTLGRIKEVTIYTEIHENLNRLRAGQDPVILKQVEVVTCEKKIAEVKVLSCETSTPPEDAGLIDRVQNCTDQPIAFTPQMNTVSKSSASDSGGMNTVLSGLRPAVIKTIDAQKEVFVCEQGTKIKDVVIFTEIFENLNWLPRNPVILKQFEVVTCLKDAATLTVESCVFGPTTRLFP